jgi:hypothetical protein
MELLKVKSSLLSGVHYDAEKQILSVEFLRKQNEERRSIYSYSGVSPEKYEALMKADSVGSHFLKFIKPNHQFTRIYEKDSQATPSPYAT